MRRKIATVFLEEIGVAENGRPGGADAENLVLTSLIWPRPMIDVRTAVKTVRLEDGEKVQFSKRPFYEKILFKEIVGGIFGITVEVTERKSPSLIARFVSGIATNLVTAVFPLPPSGEIFRRIVHAGTYGAAGRQAQDASKETIIRIAFGHVVIDPTVSASDRRLEIPLLAPESIAPPPSGRSRRPPILAKGQPNGQAVLKISIEED